MKVERGCKWVLYVQLIQKLLLIVIVLLLRLPLAVANIGREALIALYFTTARNGAALLSSF